MLAKIETLGELKEFLNSIDLPDDVPIMFSDKDNDVLYDITFAYECYIDKGNGLYFGLEDLTEYMLENLPEYAVTKEEANQIQMGVVFGYLDSERLDYWIKEENNG